MAQPTIPKLLPFLLRTYIHICKQCREQKKVYTCPDRRRRTERNALTQKEIVKETNEAMTMSGDKKEWERYGVWLKHIKISQGSFFCCCTLAATSSCLLTKMRWSRNKEVDFWSRVDDYFLKFIYFAPTLPLSKSNLKTLSKKKAISQLTI